MSKVYFADFKGSIRDNIYNKIKRLFTEAGFDKKINKKEFVAVKTHFGEYGNLAYIPAQVIRIVVDKVKECGGVPFITDTNTLYRGSRSNAVDSLDNAFKNGFINEVSGAPVIIADGLKGNDYRTVKTKGKHYKELKVASAIHDADVCVVVSHVKGHELYGFGGAMKNIAMGCVPPSGKQTIHSDLRPRVKEAACISCGTCVKRCPADAITFNKAKKAEINQAKCVSCGECTVLCPEGAIPVVWKTDHKNLHERTAEYVKGIMDLKPGKWMFLNFIMNVSPECDCYFWNDIPIVHDIGILASDDPVSIDMASADMINGAPPVPGSKIYDKKGDDNLKKLYDIEWKYLLQYAKSINIGDDSYEMINI
jgi:hypothetical protein